eukprot:8865364-Lingulodinium_polyedra.AAC.1
MLNYTTLIPSCFRRKQQWLIGATAVRTPLRPLHAEPPKVLAWPDIDLPCAVCVLGVFPAIC